MRYKLSSVRSVSPSMIYTNWSDATSAIVRQTDGQQTKPWFRLNLRFLAELQELVYGMQLRRVNHTKQESRSGEMYCGVLISVYGKKKGGS